MNHVEYCFKMATSSNRGTKRKLDSLSSPSNALEARDNQRKQKEKEELDKIAGMRKTNPSKQFQMLKRRAKILNYHHGWHIVVLFSHKHGRGNTFAKYGTPGIGSDFIGTKETSSAAGKAVFNVFQNYARQQLISNAETSIPPQQSHPPNPSCPPSSTSIPPQQSHPPNPSCPPSSTSIPLQQSHPSCPPSSTSIPPQQSHPPNPSCPSSSTSIPPQQGHPPNPSCPPPSTSIPPQQGHPPYPSCPPSSTSIPLQQSLPPSPSCPLSSTYIPPQQGHPPNPSCLPSSTSIPPQQSPPPNPSCPPSSTSIPPQQGHPPHPSCPSSSTSIPPQQRYPPNPSCPPSSISKFSATKKPIGVAGTTARQPALPDLLEDAVIIVDKNKYVGMGKVVHLPTIHGVPIPENHQCLVLSWAAEKCPAPCPLGRRDLDENLFLHKDMFYAIPNAMLKRLQKKDNKYFLLPLS